MKAEELVLVASAGTISGAVIQQKVSIPFVSSNKWYEVGLGVGVALLGFFVIKTDGVGDFTEALGIGYGASALLG